MEIVRDIRLITLSEKTGFPALREWFEERGLQIVKAFDVAKPLIGIKNGKLPFMSLRGMYGLRANIKPTHLVTAYLVCHPKSSSREATFLVEARKVSKKSARRKSAARPAAKTKS